MKNKNLNYIHEMGNTQTHYTWCVCFDMRYILYDSVCVYLVHQKQQSSKSQEIYRDILARSIIQQQYTYSAFSPGGIHDDSLVIPLYALAAHMRFALKRVTRDSVTAITCLARAFYIYTFVYGSVDRICP